MSKHDRTKSSGFLDTLFTRSAKRGQRNTYTANGTRPLSTNEADNTEMQDIETLIMRMTIEEVNQKFNEILEDMNIPKDKRDPLMEKNLDEKRKMLRMHLKGKQKLVFGLPTLTQFHSSADVLQLRIFQNTAHEFKRIRCVITFAFKNNSRDKRKKKKNLHNLYIKLAIFVGKALKRVA